MIHTKQGRNIKQTDVTQTQCF